MARKHASQGTPATAALAAAGVPFVAHPYAHDPAAASYGLEAAEVLGVDPDRVFKTLMVDVDGRLAVGVVPVSGSLDLKAMAAELLGVPDGALEATGIDVELKRTGPPHSHDHDHEHEHPPVVDDQRRKVES